MKITKSIIIILFATAAGNQLFAQVASETVLDENLTLYFPTYSKESIKYPEGAYYQNFWEAIYPEDSVSKFTNHSFSKYLDRMGEPVLYNKTNQAQNTIPTEFYIKDETAYSKNFISQFKQYHGMYETVSLIEDTIIVNNDREDFIIIPTDLPLNELFFYGKAEKEKEQILTVKRVNISTLEYTYYETVNGTKANGRQGMADLQPVFYFGAEGTFEDEDGTMYGMNKYTDYSGKDCWTSIYVGVGSTEKSFLIYDCETGRQKFSTPELVKRK